MSRQAELSLKRYEGSFKSTLKVKNLDPIAVSVSYGHNSVGNKGGESKCQAEAQLQYGKGKRVVGAISLIHLNENQYVIDGKLELPTEHVKNIQLQVKTKRSEDGNTVDSGVALIVDDKKYSLDSTFVFSAPSIKITFTHPDGKSDEFHGESLT